MSALASGFKFTFGVIAALAVAVEADFAEAERVEQAIADAQEKECGGLQNADVRVACLDSVATEVRRRDP